MKKQILFWFSIALVLQACCLQDSCNDGCTPDSEQSPCPYATPRSSGSLEIRYSDPASYDSVVVEIHPTSTVEASGPYQVLRPKSGTSTALNVSNGDWSARAVYWKHGTQIRVFDADDISSGKSYGCNCYDYTRGSGNLDLTDGK